MIRLLPILLTALLSLHTAARQTRPLNYYIETARQNSPLIQNYRNQQSIQNEELARLKAFYTHSSLEVNGDYLFVPIVSKDGGTTAFKWNAQDGTDYYGYDLGQSSGHLQAGVTWRQPLLGRSGYRTAREQAEIESAILDLNLRLEQHQLERMVTEQYQLCLLDMLQISYTNTIDTLLARRTEVVSRLVGAGTMRRTDLNLLTIETEKNAAQRTSLERSLHSHVADLNILCGISDTTDVIPEDSPILITQDIPATRSIFTERYDLDSLSVNASLRSFAVQYKPRLDLFVSTGLQVGSYTDWYKHFGWSAGLTFSWTIYDGHQQRNKERQALLQHNTIETYRTNAERQRSTRLAQCRRELADYDREETSLLTQLSEYDSLLETYVLELQAGEVSVLDYITVLRSRIQTEHDLMLLRANRRLAVIAYNYWCH